VFIVGDEKQLGWNIFMYKVRGNVDVVGINLRTKSIYLCEVAIHLTTGIKYVRVEVSCTSFDVGKRSYIKKNNE